MDTPIWLQQFERIADRPPIAPREPLWLAASGGLADGLGTVAPKSPLAVPADPPVGTKTEIGPNAPTVPIGPIGPIGSIEPPLARRLRDAGLPLDAHADGWRIDGEPNASLARIARWLADHGLAARWRGELLAVADEAGTPHAVIERAAVRPLGIATWAVHLVGHTADGAVWVQQRALDKATDPGRWDTLMGGQVAAGETIELALERETWEEAGLRLADLDAVQRYGRLLFRRPLPEGYMVERIEMVEAVVRDGHVPVNQDGEVHRFEHLAPAALRERLASGAFTLEASLVLARWLQRHSRL